MGTQQTSLSVVPVVDLVYQGDELLECEELACSLCQEHSFDITAFDAVVLDTERVDFTPV
jgi:hypothetical protein